MLLAGTAMTQEVVITDFPIGVGGSVGEEFFEPYHAQLKAVADTVKANPLGRLVITGSADGWQYRQNNDAQNPALALGRAHAVRNLLVSKYGIDSTRIMIRSEDAPGKGPQYRYASVLVVWDMSEIETRLTTIEQQPPVEKHFTEIREVPTEVEESFGLQLGGGLTSSPFGVVPILTGALVFQRTLYIEGVLGATPWTNSTDYGTDDLKTRARFVAGNIIWFPWKDKPVGFVAGWAHSEDLSKEHHQYTEASEGPTLGVRVLIINHISLTGLYNPSSRHIAGNEFSETKHEFLLQATGHFGLGGAR
jgi:hypothetical protein